MELLGPSMAWLKRNYPYGMPRKLATKYLIDMLEAIWKTHELGFIHRDIKASNFVLNEKKGVVYLVDFGLAKQHLKANDSTPVTPWKHAEFRGTVSFASLNAHLGIDLSWRDDLWSWFFVLLDFYEEILPWWENKDYSMDDVKRIKYDCFKKKKLWSDKI